MNMEQCLGFLEYTAYRLTVAPLGRHTQTVSTDTDSRLQFRNEMEV